MVTSNTNANINTNTLHGIFVPSIIFTKHNFKIVIYFLPDFYSLSIHYITPKNTIQILLGTQNLWSCRFYKRWCRRNLCHWKVEFLKYTLQTWNLKMYIMFLQRPQNVITCYSNFLHGPAIFHINFKQQQKLHQWKAAWNSTFSNISSR